MGGLWGWDMLGRTSKSAVCAEAQEKERHAFCIRKLGLGGRETGARGCCGCSAGSTWGVRRGGRSPQDGDPRAGKGSEISSGCAELDIRGTLGDVYAAAEA